MKKAQGISINTIIIAALGLAVLVVLFLIFTGRIGIFSKGVDESQSCDSICKAAGKSTAQAAGPDKQCGTGQSYVSGSYASAPNGCCCS